MATLASYWAAGSHRCYREVHHTMKITFDEEDVQMVAWAMAKSRGLASLDFQRPFAPDSTEDKIYTEALRVVAAFRNKYGN